MSLDRDVIDAVREMDEHDLRRLLMLAKARLDASGEGFASAAPNVRLREQWIKCGKPNCTRCPHGPYWYAYWTEDGTRRSRYVGKLGDDSLNDPATAAENGGTG
jgi:hypothetical protein